MVSASKQDPSASKATKAPTTKTPKTASGKSKAASPEPDAPDVAAIAAIAVDASKAAAQAADADDVTQDSSKPQSKSKSRKSRTASLRHAESGDAIDSAKQQHFAVVEQRHRKRPRVKVPDYVVPAHAVTALRDQLVTSENTAKHVGTKLTDDGKMLLSWLGSMDDVTKSSSDSCVIRCRAGFSHIRLVHNHERAWVRMLLDISPIIYFIECVGSHPVLVCAGYKSEPIQGGIGMEESGRTLPTKGRTQTVDRTKVVPFPTKRSIKLRVDEADEASTRRPHTLYGTGDAISKASQRIRQIEEGLMSTASAAKPTITSRMVSYANVWRSSNAGAPEPVRPSLLTEKKSYIEGLEHVVAKLTDAEVAELLMYKDVVVMPTAHVEEYDEEREKHMLTIRAKEKTTTVAGFHAAVSKLVRHDHLQAFCTYQTYNCVAVTFKQKVSSKLMSTINKFFREETKGATSVFLRPHSEDVESFFETNLHEVKRTVFKGAAPPSPPPPTAVRRIIGTSCAVSENAIAAIAESLKCDIVAPQDAEYNLTPLRFVGEWASQGELDEVLKEGETVSFTLGSRHVIAEIMPVPKPRMLRV